jgi:hypothetical protein
MKNISAILASIVYIALSAGFSALYRVYKYQFMDFDHTAYYLKVVPTALVFVGISYLLFVIIRKCSPSRAFGWILLGIGLFALIALLFPPLMLSVAITDFYPIACGVVMLYSMLVIKKGMA